MSTISSRFTHLVNGLRAFRRPLLVATIWIIASQAAQAATPSPCPPIGRDSGCGIIITATNTAATVTFTGQGPYDGADDTLVGVINNGRTPLSSIDLKSSTDAFGFDGDGLCSASITPHPATCPFGPTGYEGPNTTFSNITASSTMGRVNFTTPIPPGGTAYFSLEESLASATTCASILNGSVPRPASGGPSISTTFTPRSGVTLANAASLCGFTAWNWQQTITVQPCDNTFYESGNATPLTAPPPFNDPPPHGYSYQSPPNAVQLPVYYNLFTAASDPLSLAHNETVNTLSFYDAPAVRCLSGDPAGLRPKKLSFTTHLVGIVGALPGAGVQDTGIGFSWTTTYNGTVGGLNVLNNPLPVDAGSGTGSAQVTAYSPNTTYQYPRNVGVVGINGVAIVVPAVTATVLTTAQISVRTSGLAYSRATQTFTGSIQITNVGGSLLTGPFQIVFDSLANGVSLVNATGSFAGWPYISVPGAGSLAPGESATVNISISNPQNVAVFFSPVPYAGGFQ